MKLTSIRSRGDNSPKSEYTVEFQCVSTFLVGFQDNAELTDRQILAKAVEIANQTFERGGCLMLERATADSFYTFTALGIDRSSGHILGRATPQERPKLKIIKSQPG